MRADSTATWPLPNTSNTEDTANQRQDIQFSGEWPCAALQAAIAEARRQDVPSGSTLTLGASENSPLDFPGSVLAHSQLQACC